MTLGAGSLSVGGLASDRDVVDYLLSAATVRERAHALFALGRDGALSHFAVDFDRLDAVADFVTAEIRAAYPRLDVPYHSRWRHFEMGGRDRFAAAAAPWTQDRAERARARIELAIVSVLLDAGAGPLWHFREAATGEVWGRSEGLALASLAWVADGAFSTDPVAPWRVEAGRLRAVTAGGLAAAFQVDDRNALVGIEGRVDLLRRLGEVVASRPEVFGAGGRLGHFFDFLQSSAVDADGRVAADRVLAAVLRVFGPIWPGRLDIAGVSLGDTWPHPSLSATDRGRGLVPFHKLSQWLTYSLLEPLEEAGLDVVGLDGLTGLPEYRNGGLLIDLGLLVPRAAEATRRPHMAGSPLVVEWRALTVAALDLVAERVRRQLGLDATAFPLAKVLQGGTWSAGRRIARQLRDAGGPPIVVESDGTVF